jgi:hypothetical protein
VEIGHMNLPIVADMQHFIAALCVRDLRYGPEHDECLGLPFGRHACRFGYRIKVAEDADTPHQVEAVHLRTRHPRLLPKEAQEGSLYRLEIGEVGDGSI